MPWLALTITCIIMWGITDILYKKSSDYSDPLSHYKTFVWIGIIMFIAGSIMASFSDTLFDTIKLIPDNFYLVLLSFFYAIALFFGLLGKKHLDASVVSPLENIDGAMAAIILYFYFLFAGFSNITNSISIMDIIGTITILVGVVFLGIQEHKLSVQEATIAEDKKRHRLGAIALIFPIIYNLVDAISMVAIGITVTEGAEATIPDIDFFVFECAAFSLVAICMWLYMLIVKKYKYNPFKKKEIVRCGAASGETFGTMTFILAVGCNPILTAPITSSYCLVTIVLARIFLKERLTKKQYISISLLIIGIALLGISEILKG